MTPQELREKCENLRDELDKCYNSHVGEVIDLPDGNKEYLPFRESEHEIETVALLESFARSIRNAAIEESAHAIWSNRYEPPYIIETRAVESVRALKGAQ